MISWTQNAFEYLEQNPERYFTTREIITDIFENKQYFDDFNDVKKYSKQDVSTDEKLIRIVNGLVDRQSLSRYDNIKVKKISKNRYKFCFSLDNEIMKNQVTDNKASKHNLYLKLYEYLSALDIYSKRIDKNPSNESYILGIKYLDSKLYNNNQMQKFLFKVQNTLDNNINELFSNTITIKNNLSVHYAYLVAIDITPDALAKLRTYSDLGVGLIKLNCNTPEKSEMLISAEKK